MEYKKRERCANFTVKETRVLIDIILEFKEIIENRKTDSCTWKLKTQAWDDITRKFNSSFNDGKLRRAKMLRIKYESVKRNLRKKIADKKQCTIAGQPHSSVKFEDYEELLMDCIDLKINGSARLDFVNAANDDNDVKVEKSCIIKNPNDDLEIYDTKDSLLLLAANEDAISTVNTFDDKEPCENSIIEYVSVLPDEADDANDGPSEIEYSITKEPAKQKLRRNSQSQSVSATQVQNSKRKRFTISNTLNEKSSRLAEEKLRMIGKAIKLLQNEEIRKEEIFKKTMENLAKDDARREEIHKLKIQLLRKMKFAEL